MAGEKQNMEGSRNVKLVKLNKDLKKLDEEISTAVDFLQYLQQYSKDSVISLNNVSSSGTNLEEFTSVHGFLTKYLDLVEDVNCKFEVLEVDSGQDDFKFYTVPREKDFDLESLKNYRYETPQKPFEKVINKKLEKSLIDLSITSSDAESEEKEINVEKPASAVKSNLNSKIKSNVDYKGLPLPISPIKKEENYISEKKDAKTVLEKKQLEELKEFKVSNLQKKETTNNFKMEDGKNFEKIVLNEDKFEYEDVIYQIPEITISTIPHTEYEGCVEHIESPGEFYVYFIVRELKKIEVMQKLLESRSSQYHQKQPYQDPSMGEMERKKKAIDAIGEYGLWYDNCEKTWFRVKITDWRVGHDDDLVSVFLFDYGDSNRVSLNSLQPLENELRKFPMFARKCHLAGVYPLESKSGAPMVEWPKESTDLFRILMEAAERCKIVIAENDGCYPPDSIPIKLYAHDKAKTINDTIVEYEYAKYLTTPPAALPWTKKPPKEESAPVEQALHWTKKQGKEETVPIEKVLKDWDPMTEDFESLRNNAELDVDDPASAIYGYVGKDYDRICYRFGTTGQCYKGNTCRKEHKLFRPDGFTVDEEEVFVSSKNRLKLPGIGEEFKAQITCITKVNEFFCLREDQDTNPDEETIYTLNEHINEPQNLRKLKKLLVPPAAGQIVLGLFKDDDNYYRARVKVSTPEDDEYVLFFVDYGNLDTVSLKDIRKIEPQYMHLPFQAVKCQLYDVAPNPEVPKQIGVKYFKDSIENGTIIAKVVDIIKGDGTLVVRLFDSKMNDIAKDLMAKKIVVYQKTLTFKDTNDLLPS